MKNLPAFVLLVAAALVIGPSPRSTATSNQFPLSDRVEAVVIRGRDLPPGFLGGPISSYRVMAGQGSGLVPIPFQIDERDGQGGLLVKKGPRPDKTDGNFSASDEIIFMARDAGAAGAADPVAGCEKLLPVKLRDPQTGALAQAVLARCSAPPPLSPKDYIQMTVNPYVVVTDRYRLGWKERMVFAHDYMSVNNGPDLLDRLRVRASVGKWGVTYTFDEDQFTYSLRGYNDGPVRVSWRGDNYWGLGPLGKLDVPHLVLFYPETLMMNNQMDMSMNPALVGLDMFLEIGHDMTVDPARGYSVCASPLPKCLPFSTPLSPEEVARLTEKRMDWGGLCGPEGGVMVHMVADPRLTVKVKSKYTHDPAFSDPPEYVKGMMPRMSFYLVDWRDVKAEKYDLDFYFHFLDPCTMAEFNRFDRSVTNPLQVQL